MKNYKITASEISCNSCNESFPLDRKGSSYVLCKCKNLRLLKLRDEIDVSDIGGLDGERVKYKE